MPQSLLQNRPLVVLLFISFFGASLSVLFSYCPPPLQEDFAWRKAVVSLVFGLICISGILAAFFPKQCTNMLDFQKGRGNVFHGDSELSGHHPSCENFSPHVFQIGSRKVCVACTGLTVGGVLALVGTFLYLFADWHVKENMVLVVVLIGLLGVSAGLFQFGAKQRLVRFSLNVFFVLGSFLVLIGIDGLSQSMFVDLFLIALIAFWLFTRIMISQWDHERICVACDVTVCEFQKMRKRMN